jgi:hypothetical protein
VSLSQFDDFFQAVTKESAPYGYQCRLACDPLIEPSRPDALRGGMACRSQFVNISTGSGGICDQS